MFCKIVSSRSDVSRGSFCIVSFMEEGEEDTLSLHIVDATFRGNTHSYTCDISSLPKDVKCEMRSLVKKFIKKMKKDCFPDARENTFSSAFLQVLWRDENFRKWFSLNYGAEGENMDDVIISL